MPGLILYHTTTRPAAVAILRNGFDDGSTVSRPSVPRGRVWLSDKPLDCNEGAKGDVVLEVTMGLSEADISLFELIEKGKPYREWCIPLEKLTGAIVRLAPANNEMVVLSAGAMARPTSSTSGKKKTRRPRGSPGKGGGGAGG